VLLYQYRGASVYMLESRQTGIHSARFALSIKSSNVPN